MPTPFQPPAGAGALVGFEAPGALAKADLLEPVYEIASRGQRAENTEATYAAGMRLFWAWGRSTGLYPEERFPVPWEVVVTFVSHMYRGMPPDAEAELLQLGVMRGPGPFALSTIKTRFYTLSAAHRAAGVPPEENPCLDPRTKEWMKSLKRTAAKDGRSAKNRKAALTADRVFQVLEEITGRDLDGPERLRALRDAALLAASFAAGGRRVSEMLALHGEDLERIAAPEDGSGPAYMITVRQSKTDQEGEGFRVALHGEGAVRMAAWLEASGIQEGPLFPGISRGGKLFTRPMSRVQAWAIVKRWCERAGLDARKFSPHSTRAGFVTEAGRAGVSRSEAMAASGHKTAEVFDLYYRTGEAQSNPATRLLVRRSG
jgi:integrase